MHPSVHSNTIRNNQDIEATSVSIDRGMEKDVVHIYTMEYYSAIKKNGIMPFAATRMDLEIVTLSEVSLTDKGKYHRISLICGIYKKGTNEPIYKTEIESQI